MNAHPTTVTVTLAVLPTYALVLLVLCGLVTGLFVVRGAVAAGDACWTWWKSRRLYNPAPYRLAVFGGYQHRRRFGRADRRTR